MNPQKLKIALTATALAYFGANPAMAQQLGQCLNTQVASSNEWCDTETCKQMKQTTCDGVPTGDAVEVGSCTTSSVDNYTYNHLHNATDYTTIGSFDTACSSCTANTIIPQLLPCQVLQVKRIQSLRESTQPSSLGIGNFLSYDISLTLFEVNGVTYVDCFNPETWLAARRFSPSGTVFKDTIYNGIKSFTLFDANGNVTVSKSAAVRGVLVSPNSFKKHFELFDLDLNRKGGRLIKTTDAADVEILRFEYAVNAGDIAADSAVKWQKSAAHDFLKNTITFTYETKANGRSVLTRIGLPQDKALVYSYDAGGNLSEVLYPNGDRSTFTREATSTGLKITFAEAGTTGMHRNKTGLYSNNIAASLLAVQTDRPQVYNQASWLIREMTTAANELTYWNVNGGNEKAVNDPNSPNPMVRKIYEGGGRLRFIHTGEKSSYVNWSSPSGTSRPLLYDSVKVTREKFGHLSPYWQYAENRSGRPVQVTNPESPVHYFLYDGSGNKRLERIGTQVKRAASDARFNKPTMQVDFSGKAKLMAYDAAGNLVSRKIGWAFDNSLGAGVTIPGLHCEYFENVTTIDALDSSTPVSVQQTDTVALGQRETSAAKWGMRFKGKLVLEADGERTFRLSADDQARLYIDGMLVTDVAYNQGTKTAKVNLTAGAHDIRVDFVEFGGGQRLDLTWSGPETTDALGVTAWTIIGSNFLAHETSADELVLRPTDAAFEEKWEYFPTGDALAGLQKAYVDGSGKRAEYAYDANRRLIQVKETGDNGDLVITQTRTYDAAGNLASQADALGRKVEYTYDARNRLVKTAYADGTTETVTYGSGVDANLVVARKDRAGSVTKTEYDASGRAVKVLASYSLADNDGNVTQVFDKPSVTTYAYLDGTEDATRTVRDGKETERDYDYKGRVIAERTFPSQGKVLTSNSAYNADEVLFSTTDAHGCRSFYAYRRPDMVVVREVRELVPGSLGNLADEAAVLAVARATGANPGYTVTDYAKDLDGRTLISTDAIGVKSLTTYDAAGRVAAVTKAAGLPEEVTTFTAYDGAGRVLAQKDGLNRITRREYTPAGRVAAVVYPDNAREEFTYFADGKLATRKDADGFISKAYWTACCARDFVTANAKGEGTLRFYDGAGRVTYAATVKDVEAVKDFGPNLPADAVVSAQTMQYDARGRLAASTKWLVVPSSVDPKNALIATDAAQGLTTTYTYFDDLTDARIAPVLTKLAEQGITLTSGAATLVTNPAGERTLSVSDGAGRTVFSGVIAE